MIDFLIHARSADVLSLTEPQSLGKQLFKGVVTSKTTGREDKVRNSSQEAPAASGLAARLGGLRSRRDGHAGEAMGSSGGLFVRRVGLIALLCACLVGTGEAGLVDLRLVRLSLVGDGGGEAAVDGRIAEFQWPAQDASRLTMMSVSIYPDRGVPAGQEGTTLRFGAVQGYLSDQSGEATISARSSEPAIAPPSGEATVASLSGPAQSDQMFHPVTDELHCLALTIYFEARGEPEDGKLAVAHVVMNRMKDSRFPDTICRVVQQGGEQVRHRCQFTWWCDGLSDRPRNLRQWEKSKSLARTVFWGDRPDPTGGALWYHADYVAPTWAQAFSRTSQIGRHIFYQRSEPDSKLADRRS